MSGFSIESMPEGNLTVLVGNGLSIAFNQSLNLRDITSAVITAMTDANEGGDHVVNAMRRVAGRALPDGADSDDDFETLVGAFGSQNRSLGDLRDLAKLLEPDQRKLRRAIRRTAKFAKRVSDVGVSHVLETIFVRSYAEQSEMAELNRVIGGITSAFGGDVTFANLNYDTLLLSSLLDSCSADLADMGNPLDKVTVQLGPSQQQMPGLRKYRSSFPNRRRVVLVHLHGSLTYWRMEGTSLFAKLDTRFLRTHDLWGRVRRNETRLRPVVVLETQRDKALAAQAYPFSLAYEMFDLSLGLSPKWLIVGYSFRDAIVNDHLRRAFAEAEVPPRVLVVTHGDEPGRHTVESAFGWEAGGDAPWLTIARTGAVGLVDTDEWMQFVE